MTKKVFFNFWLLLIVGMATVVFNSCNKDEPNPNGDTETGLYLGIIGFNENITTKDIGLLTNSNKSQFQGFVSDLTMKPATGLYYAVDNAINKLGSATLPNDLVNVAIVTFTDGLDNASIELNTRYNSRDAYRDAVRNRINSTKVKNLNINAYSIGIKGGDVTDVDAFRAGLVALASNPNNAKEVTSMTEVNNTFREIANSLYNESQSQSIKLKITGGYDDGDKIRFTFDNVTDAANSNFYIEGTYRRSGNSRSLQNIVYQGLSSNSGATVSGDVSGVFVTFTFENTSTTSGGDVSTQNTQQWGYITSQNRWQRNSEFNPSGDSETIVERKSAVIMLVLDCTSSLDASGANGFRDMKSAANNFINVLVSGSSNSGSSSGGNGNGSNGSSSNKTKAQVRFQKTGNFYDCQEMGIGSEDDEELAYYYFGTSSGVSQYFEIIPGYHYPFYSDGWEWDFCLSSYYYNFQAGRKYTVVYNGSGFSITNDGTF